MHTKRKIQGLQCCSLFRLKAKRQWDLQATTETQLVHSGPIRLHDQTITGFLFQALHLLLLCGVTDRGKSQNWGENVNLKDTEYDTITAAGTERSGLYDQKDYSGVFSR